jgi:hypothetical protein
MILHEDGRLLIASIKLTTTCKVDRAKFHSLVIEHGDRLCMQLPPRHSRWQGKIQIEVCACRDR